MKAMSKVLVLATITLMGASAFAAENRDNKNCVESAQNVAKAQKGGQPATAPSPTPSTGTNNGNAN